MQENPHEGMSLYCTLSEERIDGTKGEGLATRDIRTPDPLPRRPRSIQLGYGRTAESDSKASAARTDIVLDGLTLYARRRRSLIQPGTHPPDSHSLYALTP